MSKVIASTDEDSLLRDDEQQSTYYNLSVASIQTALCFALEFMPNSIMLYFLGQLEDDNLVGGYGLGIMWAFCFGFGILNGLACGLETLVSQAFGAGKMTLCCKLYYRSLFVSTLMMIPIFFLMFFSDNILSLINDKEALIYQARQTGLYMLPSIYLNGIFVNTKVFLNGQNIYNLQLLTQTISCISSIGFTYMFIIHLQMGIFGTACTRLCIELLNNLIIISLILYTNCQDKMILKPEIIHLKNSFKFIKDSLPIGSILWLEWFCYEVYTMQAIQLDENKISTHVLMINLTSFLYQFSYGVSIAATTFVGNEMGAQKSKQARKYANASLVIVSIFLVVTQIPLFFTRAIFSEFVTVIPEIRELLTALIPLVVIMVILDAYQATLSGIVRGIGREKFACITFLLGYLVLGQISAYLFCFTMDLGLKGIWFGIIVGALSYDLLNSWNMIAKPWDQLAVKIDDKMKQH